MPDDGLHPPKAPMPPAGTKSAADVAEERYKEEVKDYKEDKKEVDANLKEVQADVDAGLEKAKEITENLAAVRGDTKKPTSSSKL
jgi:DNA-binding transcriptional regulator GbsR (MarR family)